MRYRVVCTTDDNTVYCWCADLLTADCVCGALNYKFYKSGAKFEVHQDE